MSDNEFQITIEYRGYTLISSKPLWHLDPLTAATLLRSEAERMAQALEDLYRRGAVDE